MQSYRLLVFMLSMAGYGLATGPMRETRDATEFAKTVARFDRMGRIWPAIIHEDVAVVLPFHDMFEELKTLELSLNKTVNAWLQKVMTQTGQPDLRSQRIKMMNQTIMIQQRKTDKLIREAKGCVMYKDDGVGTERVRRDSVFAWLGNIISITLGLTNDRAIRDLKSHEQIVHKQIVTNRGLEKDTRHALVDSIHSLEANLVDKALAESIRFVHGEIQDQARRITNMVNLAFQGVVDSHILGVVDKQGLQDKAREFATARRLKVVGGGNILTMDKSVLVSDKVVMVTFHVPMAHVDTREMDLYHLREVEVVTEGVTFVVDSQRDIVAHGPDGMAALSAADLDLCQRHDDIWLCPKVRLLERRALSCATAVFMSDRVLINRLCPLKTKLSSNLAYAYQHSVVEFQAQEVQGTVEVNCGKHRKVETWKDLRTRVVPLKCSVDNPSFRILASPTYAPTEPVQCRVQLDNATQSAYERLRKDQLVYYNNTNKIVDDLGQVGEVSALPAFTNLTWYFVVGGIIGVVVLLLGVWCCVKKVSKWVGKRVQGVQGPQQQSSAGTLGIVRLGQEVAGDAIKAEEIPWYVGLRALGK